MSRFYARRKDGNHNEIAKAFEALGYSVADTSKMSNGFPDILVAKFGTLSALVEVKSAKGKLNPGQQDFRQAWKGRIYECRSVDDVLAIDKLIMGEL